MGLNQSKFQSSCHCQAIQFEIKSDFQEMTTYDCSTCRKKNALMVKVHESDMSIIKGKDELTCYQFNTHTASHYFCRICGIYPFHRKRVTPDYYGVNVFCLDDFSPEGIPIRATDGIGMS